jgi:trk system potassium uptake protein TrkH
MLIGGGSGSTAGGIKLTRVYLLFRISIENIRKRIHPSRRVMQPFYYKAQGKTPIDEELSSDITGFISSYLFLFILGSMLLTITTNSTLTEAMFEFASSLGTVGLSIGITGPATTSITLIIQMIGMTLGRLEIFIVLIGFYSGVSLFRNKLKKHKLFMN